MPQQDTGSQAAVGGGSHPSPTPGVPACAPDPGRDSGRHLWPQWLLASSRRTGSWLLLLCSLCGAGKGKSVLVELLGTMTTKLPKKQLPERTHIWYKGFHRLRLCGKTGMHVLSPKYHWDGSWENCNSHSVAESRCRDFLMKFTLTALPLTPEAIKVHSFLRVMNTFAVFIIDLGCKKTLSDVVELCTG